jgi:alpha-glucosidase
VEELEMLAGFYGDGTDELDLGFNFPFIESPLRADTMRGIVERMEELLPAPAWPVWTGSNHDVSRLATRWAGGDAAKVRMALLMLLTLRGTPVLYQGDEIGLTDVVLERTDILDPVGRRFWPAYAGRDPARTPMPWTDAPHGGFTTPEATPWLPMGDVAACNVEAQRDDPGSVLRFVHDVVALRRSSSDLLTGGYESLPGGGDVWMWRRGAKTLVVLNMSDESKLITLPAPGARVVIGTDRARDGTTLGNAVELRGWEAVAVVERS